MAESPESSVSLECHARLCHLLMEQGTMALRQTFNNIYPPLCLTEQLRKEPMKRLLQKMYKKKKINKVQWKLIFPTAGKRLSSRKYGFSFLVILLKNICHLSAPYPNGWDNTPQDNDLSISADIARLTFAKDDLQQQYIVAEEEYITYWEYITDVLVRMLGDNHSEEVERIRHDALTDDMITQFINELKNSDKMEEKLDLTKATRLMARVNRVRKASQVPKEEREDRGVSIEERTTLLKATKMLSEKVQADNLLDKLEFYRVINIDQRREIVKSRNNVENVMFLISLVQSCKVGNPYAGFCEAISVMYPEVHSELLEIQAGLTKEASTKNRNDELIYLREVLYDTYSERFSHIHPLPWLENLTRSIEDVYVPLQISDRNGQIVDPCNIVKTIKREATPRHILLQGESGTGQTMTCEYLAYMWALKKHKLHETYNLVIYLDLQKPALTIIDMIYDQLNLNSSVVDKSAFEKILDKNQATILFVLDGYIGLPSNLDVRALLEGKIYKNSTVLLTSGLLTKYNRHLSNSVILYNFGLSDENVRACMQCYVHIDSNKNFGVSDSTIDTILQNEGALQTFKNPFRCMVASVIGSCLGWAFVLDAPSDCERLELYLKAMIDQYCARQKLNRNREFVMPEEVQETLSLIQHHAFNNMVKVDKNVFQGVDIDGSLLYKFGCYKRFYVKTSTLNESTFVCNVMRDFLAGRHLAGQTEADLLGNLDRYSILQMSRYERAIAIMCRLIQKYEKIRNETEEEEEDYTNEVVDDDKKYRPDMPNINDIFTMIVRKNMRRSKSISFPEWNDEVDEPTRTRGKMLDFSFGLQCLNECEDNDDLVGMVSEAMPTVLVIKHDGILPTNMFHGLIQTLSFNDSIVSEIEIHFSQIHIHQLWEIEKLGVCIARHPRVSSVKIISQSLRIITNFIACCLGENTTIHTVHLELAQEAQNTENHVVDTMLQAALHDGCTHMSNIQALKVRNYKLPEITQQILHNIPETVGHLDFTGCHINTMAGHELSRMLRHSKHIHHLDLSNIQVDTTTLHTILQGVRLSHSLTILNLSHTPFVRSTFKSLCQTLRLSASLRSLHINRCTLTVAMAEVLADILHEHETMLQDVYMIDVVLQREGMERLRSATNNSLRIWPMHEKTGLSPLTGAA